MRSIPSVQRRRRPNRSSQAVGNIDRSLAQEVRRLPAPAVEERRGQRRLQGSGHRQIGHRPHSGETKIVKLKSRIKIFSAGQPRSMLASPHLPCPRSHQPLHVIAMPRRADADREGGDLTVEARRGRASEEEAIEKEASKAEGEDDA